MKINKSYQLSVLRLIYTFLGLGYSILQVQLFGATREIETFFVAQSLVYLISSLTQTGQLSEVFLPVYLSIKHEHNHVEAQKAFSVVLNRLLVIILLLVVLLYFISPLLTDLMVPGYTSADKRNVISLFRAF